MVVSIRNPAVIAAINQEIDHLGTTKADVDYWVATVANGGSDTNPGTSALPFATAQKAADLIPYYVNHIVSIHFGRGIHLLPIRGWLINQHALNGGFIRLFADEVFDPAVYSTILNGVADAGTGQLEVKVVGGGLTPDALLFGAIEWMDGDAEGLRQSIRDNDTDTITPVLGFDLANSVKVPAAGDSFRVIVPDQTDLRAPAGAPVGAQTYQLSKKQTGFYQDFAFFEPTVFYGNYSGGLIFEGFRFSSADLAGWQEFSVHGDTVHLYGCHMPDASLLSTAALFVEGQCLLGTGAKRSLLYADYDGWGLNCEQRFIKTIANTNGYIVGHAICPGNTDMSVGSRITLLGSRMGRFNGGSSSARVALSNHFSGKPMLVDVGGFGFLELGFTKSLQDWRLVFVEVRDMGLALVCAGTGTSLFIDSGFVEIEHTGGGQFIECNKGGTILVRGLPDNLTASTVGTPVLDWSIDGVAFDPLVHLANANDEVTAFSVSGGSVVGQSVIRRDATP